VGAPLPRAGTGRIAGPQLTTAPAAPAHPARHVALVEALRRERWTGQRIARHAGLSRATVSRLLPSRMRDLAPAVPVRRYEHAAPGDLLHLDIKKPGRIVRPGHRVTGGRRDSV
jgi:hypothetical protein